MDIIECFYMWIIKLNKYIYTYYVYTKQYYILSKIIGCCDFWNTLYLKTCIEWFIITLISNIKFKYCSDTIVVTHLAITDHIYL